MMIAVGVFSCHRSSPRTFSLTKAHVPRQKSLRKTKQSAAPADSARPAIRAERELIEACLAAQPAAWSQLYDHCHEPLLAAIRGFLREAATDLSLVDEIAARVWYSLVRDDATLLSRFDIS